MALGQKYLKFLLDEDVVQGDLIGVARMPIGGVATLAFTNHPGLDPEFLKKLFPN